MPVHNQEIAGVLEKMADLLEIEGANPFRVRAYRNAAFTVESEARSISDMIEEGDDLTELPGIGKDLAAKISEIARTGKLHQLEELEEKLPEDLSTLMGIGGLGPKRIHILHEELGISTVDELKQAAERGEIQRLKGFGRKTEKKILEEIASKATEEKRIKFIVADEIARSILSYLKGSRDVRQAVVAGSYRRKKETVGDLDVLVICVDQEKVMDYFTRFEDVRTIVSKGTTRSTVILRSGLQMDLRAVPEVSYGAALHYFTGSRLHSIAIRKLGQEKGLKINEYGVFHGDDRIAGLTEDEVFHSVGLPYIEPELREDRGEIEAARRHALPHLITLRHIRGDLHTHTKATDGRNTLEEMVRAAVDIGYEYIAITNHSPEVTIAHGMDKKALLRQMDEIDRVNERFPEITVLKSAEVDILLDGSLDYPDDILKKLDFTVCSIHYHQRLPEEKQTERVIRAMDNPYFTILAHPTGRLINERKPYEIDMERVMEAAREKGCFLELNAHPDRLDLNDINCKAAKEMGIGIAISTDAHSVSDLNYMYLGINQARRGWLETGDVINCLPVDELKRRFNRR
ncbi:MAG TPA: DNA polymerase/3'-5' exonuclease PolX [Deltaproteobacteria bacterium]|jgi:DNA polymerase (family 10)|nr:DNA polymerase/3'-5' exonuclease PolX [Deltaproteobacteria bacterium]HQI00227.1 DNA polymerase/3'-5' exonuclease PolX [Deltaproteobacteria bacterium]HQJ07914.1 DNA polymerase/3'-5' exonuclease PolX [Deltaproteobacteria bacterium]